MNMKNDLVSSRPYAGTPDLQAMLALIRQRPPGQVTDFPGIIDLQEMLALPKIQANTRLWTSPEGQLVSFAILDGDQTSATLIFEIAPGWKDAGLEGLVMDWIEASFQQNSPAHTGVFYPGSQLPLRQSRTDHPAGRAWFRAPGRGRSPSGTFPGGSHRKTAVASRVSHPSDNGRSGGRSLGQAASRSPWARRT